MAHMPWSRYLACPALEAARHLGHLSARVGVAGLQKAETCSQPGPMPLPDGGRTGKLAPGDAAHRVVGGPTSGKVLCPRPRAQHIKCKSKHPHR